MLSRRCGRKVAAAIEKIIREHDFLDGDKIVLTTEILIEVPSGRQSH